MHLRKIVCVVLLLFIAISAGCGKKEDAGSAPPKETHSEVQHNENSNKIIGQNNVIDDNGPVEVGGILGKIDKQSAEVMKDSIDEEQVAQLSKDEQDELIGNMDVLVDQHDSVLVVVKEKLEENEVDANVDKKTGKVSMNNNILFEQGEYTLSDEGKRYLDDFFSAYAEAILSDEVSDYVSEIQIVGNSSSEGDYEKNKVLSENRAATVKDYCLSSESNGLDEKQREKMKNLINAFGVSSDNPVLGENGEEDQQASRRVEFKFIMKI